MAYKQVFLSSTPLIKALGEANAHMMWAIALYLEEPDPEALASEGLTDGKGDRKIDFIYLDRDAKRIVFAQGYYAKNTTKNAAPANKASDLNTAAAWLLSGDIALIPKPLGPIIEECRTALADGEVESIELLYVHNLPESVNVNRELQTAAAHMRRRSAMALPSESSRESLAAPPLITSSRPRAPTSKSKMRLLVRQELFSVKTGLSGKLRSCQSPVPGCTHYSRSTGTRYFRQIIEAS